jgi:hypothetical protein
MAAVKIFDLLRERINKSQGLLPMERRAWFWFKTYATELTKWQQQRGTMTYNKLSQQEFTKQSVAPSHVFPGFFYFYMYDPKLKATLPYYDRFPFTLVLSREANSFLGINFHYLDYKHRAMLFDAIYPFREGRVSRPNVRDIRMRMLITYDILKSAPRYKYFKPCIKRYLIQHVQTPLLKVGAKEWDVALFLPVEMFVKETKYNVWLESETKF